MDHKKIVKTFQHFGTNVTDLNVAGSTIKMNDKTIKVQGIDTDAFLPSPDILRCSNQITYVVGNSDDVTRILCEFAKVLREDMQYNVIYDTKQNAIVAAG